MSLARTSFALALVTLVPAAAAMAQTPPPPDPNVVVVTAQLSGGNEIPAACDRHRRPRKRARRDRPRRWHNQLPGERLQPADRPDRLAHPRRALGSNGPIILDFRPQQLGISNDFSLSGTLTAADLRPSAAGGINSFDDAIFSIASGVTYVNVHTQANPGGEIRGQLCPDAPIANRFNGVAVCTAAR